MIAADSPARSGAPGLAPAVARAWKPLTLAALAVWLLAVSARHEPWFDEAQAWLIARDSSLAQIVLVQARYEGTPPLWHMVLWACIRAGLPYAQLHLVSAACALAGAAIVLWRAPFPALRIGVMASYFFAYQFAVVARSYALDLVVLPALASLFAARARRPLAYGLLIGLLANCNAHSFLAAGVLGLEFAWTLFRTGGWRAPRALGGAAIAAALGLLALYSAWQPADNGYLDPSGARHVLFTAGAFVSEALIDRLVFLSSEGPSLAGAQQGLILSILTAAPCVAACIRAGQGVLAGALLIVLVGFSAAYYASPWHAGLLFLVWLFLNWIGWPGLEGRRDLRLMASVAMGLVCLVQAAQAGDSGLWDLKNSYAGGTEAARAVADWRASHPGGTVAAAGFKAFTLQPYFKDNLFANYKGGAARPAYVSWRRGEAWRPGDTPHEAAMAFAAGYGLVVVPTGKLETAEVAQILQSAQANGYRSIRLARGHIVWKGFEREDNGLALFERSAVAPERAR